MNAWTRTALSACLPTLSKNNLAYAMALGVRATLGAGLCRDLSKIRPIGTSELRPIPLSIPSFLQARCTDGFRYEPGIRFCASVEFVGFRFGGGRAERRGFSGGGFGGGGEAPSNTAHIPNAILFPTSGAPATHPAEKLFNATSPRPRRSLLRPRRSAFSVSVPFFEGGTVFLI